MAKKKLSFLLFENHQTPKFFEINPAVLRFLLFIFPLITFLSLIIVFAGAYYFKDIRVMVQKKEPVIINQLKGENNQLLQTQEQLKAEIKKLEKRLTTPVSIQLDTLSLFQLTPGLKDLSANPPLKTDNIKITSDASGTRVNFNIVNKSSEETRVAGYFIIFAKGKEQIEFYPKAIFSENAFKVAYNQGEYFATSRFRPVNIKFSNLKSEKNLVVTVYIFSRFGDLIFKEVLDKNESS